MLSPRTATFAPPPNRFRSRGLATVATAGAGCALVSVAQAQIIYSGTKNIIANGPGGALGPSTATIDFNNDGVRDITFVGKILRFTSASSTQTAEFVTTTAGGTGLAKLPSNTSISSSSPFSDVRTGVSSSYVLFSAGNWGPASSTNTGYFGFSFVTGGSTYYGWAQAQYTGSDTGTVIEWAYNSTPGASILVGQTSSIPEPATTAMLMSVVALGGATWWKKRQRDRAVPAQREAVVTVAAGTDLS